VTQPLKQPCQNFSLLPLDIVREQILIGERLLDNALQIFVDTLGVTDCLILDGDLDSGKVLYRSSIQPQNISLVNSSRYLCCRYQNQLKKKEMMVISGNDLHSPLSTPLSIVFPRTFGERKASEKECTPSLIIIPLQVQQGSPEARPWRPLGFLCLYYDDYRSRQSAENAVLGSLQVERFSKTSDIESSTPIIRHLAYQCALILQQWQQLGFLDREDQDRQTRQESHQDKVNEYLAHVTHELRAPLAGILGFARMLQEQIYGTLNTKQYQYISAIASSGEHLLSLVNDFQDISKIEANYEEIFLEKLAVEDVCLASLSIVQAKAEEQGLDLQLQIAPNVDFCWADQQRLKQILVNLLSNAIKFTETGSVTLKVINYKECLTFSVIDTGIGISREDREKLFQPFQQIPNSLGRKHKGTGLGLALSRKLARLHGGDITVISQKGKGSCFMLDIPNPALLDQGMNGNGRQP
jgi:signal transduction histidine kinase